MMMFWDRIVWDPRVAPVSRDLLPRERPDDEDDACTDLHPNLESSGYLDPEYLSDIA